MDAGGPVWTGKNDGVPKGGLGRILDIFTPRLALALASRASLKRPQDANRDAQFAERASEEERQAKKAAGSSAYTALTKGNYHTTIVSQSLRLLLREAMRSVSV